MNQTSTNPQPKNTPDSETLYVLQNADLMQQIGLSSETHRQSQGYQLTAERIDQMLNP